VVEGLHFGDQSVYSVDEYHILVRVRLLRGRTFFEGGSLWTETPNVIGSILLAGLTIVNFYVQACVGSKKRIVRKAAYGGAFIEHQLDVVGVQ
jgi:hypothetical protein